MKTETAWTARPRRASRRGLKSWGADVIGCNCSVGPVAMLDVIERVRAAHFPAPGGPTERRNAAISRRPKYLPVLARIHGELCPQVCGRGSAPGRRMLRYDAGAHPGHEVGAARGRGAGKTASPVKTQSETAVKAAPACRWKNDPAWAPRSPPANSLTMVEIVPPKGNRHPQGSRRRAISEIGGRGRHQYSRQPAGFGAHEQPGLVPAGAAGSGDRGDPALHLPRPQRAEHAVGPAGRGCDSAFTI